MYRKSYSNRYQTPLQGFCLVHLCDTLIRCRQSDSDTQDIIAFCLEMLHEALPGFAFVGPLQAMFCQTVLEQRLLLPKDVNKLMGNRTQYGPEEFLDVCERVTYSQPVDLLIARLDDTIADRWEREWQDFIEAHGCSGEGEMAMSSTAEGTPQPRSERDSPSNRSMQINSLVNP